MLKAMRSNAQPRLEINAYDAYDAMRNHMRDSNPTPRTGAVDNRWSTGDHPTRPD